MAWASDITTSLTTLLIRCCRRSFHLVQNGCATLAYRRILRVFAHVHGIVPAALAFLPRRTRDLHMQRRVAVSRFCALQHYRRYDEQRPKFLFIPPQQRIDGLGGPK